MRKAPDVQVDTARCTACRACELICHYHRTGAFGAEASSIQVAYEAETAAVEIHFENTCDACGGELMCVDACVPGALQRATP